MRSSLRHAIKGIRQEISNKKRELDRYETIYELLYGPGGMRRGRGDRHPVGERVDWVHMLKNMPGTFTVDDLAKKPALKIKSRAYLNRVLMRLVGEDRLVSLGGGKFRKKG